jgi:formylglycine-generating enzyme required for sulfatase activity
MSRAGKFIPGGSNKAKRTGPIRAPDPNAAPGAPGGAPDSGDGKKRLLNVGGLRKPISKSQKWPIYVMSAFVCCLLCSVAWYIFGFLPMKHKWEQEQADAAAAKVALAKEQADEAAKAAAAAAAAAAAKGAVTVDSNPSGAKVTVGDVSRTTPAKIDNLPPGSYPVIIQMDGYEDFQTNVAVTADAPADLGTVNLVQKTGTLTLASPQDGVTYTLTGPGGYTHQGTIPDKLAALPIGDYTLSVTQEDWTLPPMPLNIADHAATNKDIRFPYAKVTITSTPGGATVRDGRTVLGTTPLTLPPVRPKELHLTVDLAPYTLQTLDLPVGDFATINKNVELPLGKDFIASCGMAMVWIPDGGFWAAKYLFPQGEFEKVAGYNPSYFRGANLPVESISWESAAAFVAKLNDYETKAGKVPAGFHYSLPSESQWEQFNADANMAQAALSTNSSLTSTQPVGYSAPNKYGLYDTIGNVWELCLDSYDDKGDHSVRGGTWLSQPENFPNAAARQGVPPKYADKFIGFRVVLVPNAT